jgi:SAM-dependent methyltransferase
MNCRFCSAPLTHVFLDLGSAPPSNGYLTREDLSRPETFFPLKLFVCAKCWLVQTEDYACASDLFSADYAYYSSTSTSWLKHARTYSKMITQRLGLSSRSFVVEVAANDGYLLQNFVSAGIRCLGVEPTSGTAAVARQKGITICEDYFGEKLGDQIAAASGRADLIIGNNVYAHVPAINDFTLGLKRLLAENGTITLEFPHLLRLLEQRQFDTVYHEHFSYFSLHTVFKIFLAAGLRVFDVEELPTHGGSLRVYGCHADDARATSNAVAKVIGAELDYGMQTLQVYVDFQKHVDHVKIGFLRFLLDVHQDGRSIAGYGAAAKGNTLLNYAGVRCDLVPYVCDAARSKQGKYLPGSHIPIREPSALMENPPDVVLIFPWNIADEIVGQLRKALPTTVQYVTAIPGIRTVNSQPVP